MTEASVTHWAEYVSLSGAPSTTSRWNKFFVNFSLFWEGAAVGERIT